MSLDSEFFGPVYEDDVDDFVHVDEDAVIEGIKDLLEDSVFQDKLIQDTLNNRIEGYSFSIPLVNSRKFQYEVKEEYENKPERLGLLRQTFYNIGVQPGNAACGHEGFLFKGYQLNEYEFKALWISCKRKWGFFLCKFFVLENLIKTQQITLKEWKTHEQNIRHPLLKDQPKLITTVKYFDLFETHFSITTSPDVALATLGSIHRLQGLDANDSKFLSRCIFSERFNLARCRIAQKLNSQGRTEEMKRFLILQLDQLHTDTTKKRPRAEGQEEKLAGKEVAEGPPQKKKIKAVVLKAAPEDMVDSDDSKTSRENSPATSPDDSPRDDAKGVKEEEEYEGAEAEVAHSTAIKTMQNFLPELTVGGMNDLLTSEKPNWLQMVSNTVSPNESKYLVEDKTPEDDFDPENPEEWDEDVPEDSFDIEDKGQGRRRSSKAERDRKGIITHQAPLVFREYKEASEQRHVARKVKKKVWVQVIVCSFLMYGMDLYLPRQNPLSDVELLIGFFLSFFLVVHMLSFSPSYISTVLTIVCVNWVRTSKFAFVPAEIYGVVAIQMLCLEKKYVMTVPVLSFLAYSYFTGKSWLILVKYSVTCVTFYKGHRTDENLQKILVGPYRTPILAIVLVFYAILALFGFIF